MKVSVAILLLIACYVLTPCAGIACDAQQLHQNAEEIDRENLAAARKNIFTAEKQVGFILTGNEEYAENGEDGTENRKDKAANTENRKEVTKQENELNKDTAKQDSIKESEGMKKENELDETKKPKKDTRSRGSGLFRMHRWKG